MQHLLWKDSVGENNRKSTEELIKKLGLDIEDKTLFDIALLHRSYSSKYQIEKDNERLEFLGDSILNACVSDMLFKKFPEKKEGELTKIRARLVSRKALRRWGNEIGLEKYVLITEKMRNSIASRKTHIIENAMEAIVGAVYLNKGYKTVYNFIKEYVERQNFHKIVDFKSRLQEYSVQKYNEIPEYRTLTENGPPHHKEFEVEVIVNKEVLGKGKGYSKKAAQQSAAEKAYNKLVINSKEEKNG